MAMEGGDGVLTPGGVFGRGRGWRVVGLGDFVLELDMRLNPTAGPGAVSSTPGVQGAQRGARAFPSGPPAASPGHSLPGQGFWGLSDAQKAGTGGVCILWQHGAASP